MSVKVSQVNDLDNSGNFIMTNCMQWARIVFWRLRGKIISKKTLCKFDDTWTSNERQIIVCESRGNIRWGTSTVTNEVFLELFLQAPGVFLLKERKRDVVPEKQFSIIWGVFRRRLSYVHYLLPVIVAVKLKPPGQLFIYCCSAEKDDFSGMPRAIISHWRLWVHKAQTRVAFVSCR